jgi:hypothetical protein
MSKRKGVIVSAHLRKANLKRKLREHLHSLGLLKVMRALCSHLVPGLMLSVSGPEDFSIDGRLASHSS